MKNIFFIFTFLIFCNTLIAQNTSSKQNQIKWFESGQKYLKKGKLEVSASQFHVAILYDKNSELGILARQKIDSLLPLIQKQIVKQWKGNWKMKQLNYNPYPEAFSDYIRFDDNNIIFYQKNSNGEEVVMRTEQIRFLPYDSMKSDLNVRKVVFKNSEIWSFWCGKKKSQKRLYTKLEIDSLGIGKIMLDERGIIINRKLRKRELKKEIYTFYVIAK